MSEDKTKSGGDTSSIWGGRFFGGPDTVMENINASIDFDKRMYAQDIAASKAHAQMLAEQGIITSDDALAIVEGLDAVKVEIETGEFQYSRALEDIHMNVEVRLKELIGAPAGRLHTGRSRNDQVATDLRLWVRDALDELDADMKALQSALIAAAEVGATAIMPGFTHLQLAQPVTLGHHLLAYVEMIGRDRGRAKDCRARMNESPLGAAALAGTSFPLDRDMTAKALGFERPMANSMDAVAARDFALEFLAFASILSVHLSRLAEDYVIRSSQQFAYVQLSDKFSTGSSIMPQKRNPDAAELIRAKAGRVIGALNGVLIVMKGLPMTYVKDMQEDKEPVFDAFDTLKLSLVAMTGMLENSSFDTERMAADAGLGFSTATDLADWLVSTFGMPFRNAHQLTGKLVKLAEEKGGSLSDLSLAEMQSVEPSITDDIFNVLDVERAIARRTLFGGASPNNVIRAARSARKRFLD